MTEAAPPAPPTEHRRHRVPFNRYTPYLVVILLSALSPALPHNMSPNLAWWGAAGGFLLVMVLVGWAASVRPDIPWLWTLAPLLLLPAIQCLRNADGNSASGFSSLVYLPVIWFAFYGTRRAVILAVIGGACVQVLPMIIVGKPQYPDTAWRGTTLFLLVLTTVGPLVHTLIRQSREANDALSVSEKQFRAAFDGAPGGSILANGDGRVILQVNQAMCAMLGRASDEIVGHDPVELTHPDDIASTIQRQETIGSLPPGKPVEKRFMHASGREVWVSISFSVIRDGDGVPVNIICQVEDITSKREADRALLESLEVERQAAAHRRELEKARRDLVSSVSHDLRTPITSAVGFTELLEDGGVGPLNDEQRHMLGTVHRSLDRLSAIVDDLLALSRTDQDPAPRIEVVDIGEIVDGAVQGIAVSASVRGQVVRYTNDLAGVHINGDAARLDRALGNLLSNAIKFTPEDGEIGVKATHNGQTASIEVSDTGMGIPAEDLEHIFDQYYRSKAARDGSIAGTGLGLAIVSAIAEQHSGMISVASNIGEGTTFTLSLPLAT